MNVSAGSLVAELQAPLHDRGELVAPRLPAAGQLIAENCARRRAGVGGVPLTTLAAQARTELLQAAHRYSSSYRDVSPPVTAGPIILAGHQPQMFHVGVWCKNFLLSKLA